MPGTANPDAFPTELFVSEDVTSSSHFALPSENLSSFSLPGSEWFQPNLFSRFSKHLATIFCYPAVSLSWTPYPNVVLESFTCFSKGIPSRVHKTDQDYYALGKPGTPRQPPPPLYVLHSPFSLEETRRRSRQQSP